MWESLILRKWAIHDTPAAFVHSYATASICSYAAVGSASDVYMVAANNGVYVENPQIANLSDE